MTLYLFIHIALPAHLAVFGGDWSIQKRKNLKSEKILSFLDKLNRGSFIQEDSCGDVEQSVLIEEQQKPVEEEVWKFLSEEVERRMSGGGNSYRADVLAALSTFPIVILPIMFLSWLPYVRDIS